MQELPSVVPVCAAYRLRAKLSWGGANRRFRRIADFATSPKRKPHFCIKMYEKPNGQGLHSCAVFPRNQKPGGSVKIALAALRAAWGPRRRSLGVLGRVRTASESLLRATFCAKCRRRWFGRASGDDFGLILDPEDLKKYGFS